MATGGWRGVVPQGRAGEDPPCFELTAIPHDFHRRPGGIGARRPALQAALALPLRRFGAALAGRLGARRMIQGGVPAPPRDHGHMGCDAGYRQRHRGKAAVDHHDQPAARQPATPRFHHRPHPIHTGLVPLPWGRRWRPAQRGETRQRPDPSTPRYRDQEHHRDPCQAKATDDVLLGGAHRIPIAPVSPDLSPRPAFPRVVGAEDDRGPRRHPQRDQPSQQNPAPVAGRPGGTSQHPMVVGEASGRPTARGPEGHSCGRCRLFPPSQVPHRAIEGFGAELCCADSQMRVHAGGGGERCPRYA
jgi:hypothetical protein